MTPDELRSLAAVMRELGVYRLTVEGVTIEMSQTAIAAAEAERSPRVVASPTQPAPPADGDEDDPYAYAATEGLPG